ncbi:AvrD family protein [Microbacterium sp. ZW T5_45]|uniref:AvrD family protein n=1 Tax=Microbacterium sp. ZW T5_45 TaxID=3378080 RepID=UPI0038552CAC
MTLSAEPQEHPAAGTRSIEDLLGPSEERYFAAGYRGVQYALEAARVGSSHLTKGVGRVAYPLHWSAGRNGTPATPHLSSVDAVVLSLQLAEIASPSVSTLSLEDLRVGAIELRAGARPWLAVDAVPITLAVEPHAESCSLIGNVGNMRVRIELVRAVPSPRSVQLPPPTANETVYGGLFQSANAQSLIQSLDTNLGILRGTHTIEVTSPRTPADGVEALLWPSPTVIDYLVTMGQLTQALVYSSAGTTRSEAGSLWMRTMNIRIQGHPRPFPVRFDTTTTILHDRVLDRGGNRIHDVLVESSATSGVTARSTLAYEESHA